ncbi:MAG: hypothetical protein Ct9H300mP19_07060 [Dehalococcoidia bacterium]|nr:MAG: hypothetical protein Ct9H300mP19_07060 [Dehalococcoidia bacterium]
MFRQCKCLLTMMKIEHSLEASVGIHGLTDPWAQIHEGKRGKVSDQWELDQSSTATGNLVDSTFTNRLKNGVCLMPGDMMIVFLDFQMAK